MRSFCNLSVDAARITTVAGPDDPDAGKISVKDLDNGIHYQTGKACITNGCVRKAGTAWSRLWCFECNVKRMKRIDKNLREIDEHFGDGE